MDPSLSVGIQPTILFENEKYTGEINVSIQKDTKTSAIFIQVIGERISLENFQGKYADSLKEIFGSNVVSDRQELSDLREIFGDVETMQTYGSGTVKTDEEINDSIERDASRPYKGNPFTGFAVIHRQDNKIIGRVSIGSGYKSGESQSGLIINKGYRGKKCAQETIRLAGALASVFFEQKFSVGNPKALVDSFTATALKTNEQSISLITRFGLELDSSWNGDETRDLYRISAKEVDGKLEQFIDKSKLTISVTGFTDN